MFDFGAQVARHNVPTQSLHDSIKERIETKLESPTDLEPNFIYNFFNFI